jgi:hypothetical protein
MNFYLNTDEPVDILAVLPGGIIKSNLSEIVFPRTSTYPV